MLRYANPYYFEPGVSGGDQVYGRDIVLCVVDEFGNQDVETGS